METQTQRPTVITALGSGGTLLWSDTANAVTADGNAATVHTSLGGNVVSRWLLLTGFGFTTSGAILDYDLFIRRKISASVPGLAVYSDPYLYENGAITQSLGSAGNYSTSYATENPLLVPSGLTAATCNASNSGIALRIQYENGDGVTDVIASIDDLYVTIAFAANRPKFPGTATTFRRPTLSTGSFRRPRNSGAFRRPVSRGVFERPSP